VAIVLLSVGVVYLLADSLMPEGYPFYNLALLSSFLPVKPKLLRLTRAEQAKFTLSEDLKSILVGSLLGDLCAEKLAVNVRLKFKQGIIHEDYLLHLYNLFHQYCPQGTKVDRTTLNGKVHNGIYFRTYSLPCFNELYELFYPSGKKIIPENIGEMFTPLSLAYLIADDGSFNSKYKCVILNTQCFSFEEVNLLTKVLNEKFNLDCTVNKNRNAFVIRISPKSLPILQSLLGSIIPPMMKHKIGL